VSSSSPETIDRRQAAVAAALAGTVVVVLGYASGVGIRTTSDPVAIEPPVAQPATPQTDGPATAAPPITAMQMPFPTSAAHAPHHQARPAAPHDHMPAEPSPTLDPEPEPEPEPVPTPCAPSLMEDLPVAGSLVEAASSLLFTVVGSTPVLTDLDPLTCSVRDLVGPPCCAPAPALGDLRAEAGP
jgi:hypothetical protein